jgi:DNA-binding response OmpR family regulator
MASAGSRLLVVDDSEELLNILSRELAASGYEVAWARNGEDALKLLTRDERPIALMIVDVVLPGMSGPELAEQVRGSHPEAGVMYLSAYDKQTVRSHGVDPDVVPFLSKPYEAEELLSVVKAALGSE